MICSLILSFVQVLNAVESPSSKLTRLVLARDEAGIKAQLEDMKMTGSLTHTINGKGRDGLSGLIFRSHYCLWTVELC
jgi:hypothetical protein